METYMHFSINWLVLKTDLRALSERIRGLKRLLRAPWLTPMAEQQRELMQLKSRATELCALAAFARGRFHLQRAPRGASDAWSVEQYHRAIAERLGPSYAHTLEQSA